VFSGYRIGSSRYSGANHVCASCHGHILRLKNHTQDAPCGAVKSSRLSTITEKTKTATNRILWRQETRRIDFRSGGIDSSESERHGANIMQAEREGWVAKRLVAAFRGKFRDSGTARVPAQLSLEPLRNRSYFGKRRTPGVPTTPPKHTCLHSPALAASSYQRCEIIPSSDTGGISVVSFCQGVERERSSIRRTLAAAFPRGFVRKYAWNCPTASDGLFRLSKAEPLRK
jgi:hypothetical protein